MSSLLVISNKALSKLGVKNIRSLTEQGKVAARCNEHVRQAVKEVLRQHTWSHAAVWASLPQLAVGPPFGYEHAYQAPMETEKVFDVRQLEDLAAPKIDFEMVRGKVIYTDAEPCYARYIVYNEADLAQAPADFVDTCAFKLASEIAVPLSKTNMQPNMNSGYLYTLREARTSDTRSSRERKTDENRECKFLSVRHFPSSADAEVY